MLRNPEESFDPIHVEKTVEVVVPKDVCDTICTLPELEQVINGWKFDYQTNVCTCVWLTSLTCNWTTALDPNETLSDVVAYVQLSKTLPCGMLMLCIK